MREAVARALPFARVPVEPDRDTARAWAQQELSRAEYRQHRPGLLQRALTWLYDQLQNLPAMHGSGARTAAVVVLAALLVVLVVAVRRGGVLRRAGRAGAAVFADPTRSAADHRSAAETAERGEDWRTAVLERFRAVTRELEERAVIVPLPGRTADEVAVDAAAWLPRLQDALREGARLFDDVRYGDRPASATAAATLRELDEQIRRTRPASSAVPVAGGLVAPS